VLTGSVGAGGKNAGPDVLAVQRLLNQALKPPARPIAEDGLAEARTIAAIRTFQTKSGLVPADGRVDPGGATYRALSRVAAAQRPKEKAEEVKEPDDILARLLPATIANPLRGWAGHWAHPASPVGGGGPGNFRLPGVMESLASVGDVLIHPQSLARMFWGPQDSKKGVPSRALPAKSATVSVPPSTTGKKLVPADFDNAAKSLGAGVSAAIIHAFATVESGGKSGFNDEGLPVIAFEGHWFRKMTKKQYDKDYPLLSYPYVKKAGPEWVVNNKDQKTAWKTLTTAMALDHSAALQSCSWGMFQVMGFNYSKCGYKNVDEFVDAMKLGENGQLAAFVGFCKKTSGMVQALIDRDYVKMATLYNGEDYGDYDKRIERAYKKFSK